MARSVLAEITTTANLTHPHILPLFDSGQADSFLFYVMPHIGTGTGDAVSQDGDPERPERLILVTNWFEELRQRLGGN